MKRDNLLMVLFILVVAGLVLVSLINEPSITGLAVLDNAEVFAGKDTYTVGEMAHIFVMPADVDYDIEVYGPDNKLVAVSTDFPVERAGKYSIEVILNADGKTKKIKASFDVVVEAKQEIPEEYQGYNPESGAAGESPEGMLAPEEQTLEEEQLPVESITPRSDRIKIKGPKDYNLGKKEVEFNEGDISEEETIDKDKKPIKAARLEKQGIKIEVRGAGRDEIKNAWVNKGVVHIDSVPIEDATISIPHDNVGAISIAPKLYIKEDGEEEFSLANSYEKDGIMYNDIDITPEDYIFNVEHFTDYYVNTSGGDYSTLTDCLFAVNNTADACMINEAGLWIINNSYNFYMTATTMKVNADNVVLDCNASYFKGDDTGVSDYGVYTSSRSNVTVRNCSFEKFYAGIYLGCSYCKIHNNFFYDNGAIGAIYGPSSQASFNNITNNTFISNAYGVNLYFNCNNNTLVNNTVISNSGVAAIQVRYSKGNNVYNNLVESSSQRGIYLLNSENTNVFNNTAVSQTSLSYGGIVVVNSNLNNLSYNNLTNNYNGIYLTNSDNNTIINNIIPSAYSTGDGIIVSSSSDNNDISDNTINGISTGNAIKVYSSSNYNNISNNNISNSYYGVYLDTGAQNNSVLFNLISCSADGVHIFGTGTNYNNVSGNTITAGVSYKGALVISPATGNKIWLNNFYNLE
ncbi:MAG: right-handed parallel beta-helix repeat-containing protein [Nanoarchaeota archaeon]|nr:right-handed parallel beta-helix repeat-containing protein [Nanoarchaeota archaeon]